MEVLKWRIKAASCCADGHPGPQGMCYPEVIGWRHCLLCLLKLNCSATHVPEWRTLPCAEWNQATGDVLSGGNTREGVYVSNALFNSERVKIRDLVIVTVWKTLSRGFWKFALEIAGSGMSVQQYHHHPITINHGACSDTSLLRENRKQPTSVPKYLMWVCFDRLGR